MRILFCLAACVLCIAATGYASPLTDFEQGRSSIDLNYRFSQDFNIPLDTDFKAKNVLADGSVTVGLGNKFALQYRNFNSQSKYTFDFSGYNWGARMKLTSQEINLLYGLNKNWQVYTGYVSNKGTQGLFVNSLTDMTNHGDGSIAGSSKNTWQFGVVGSTSFSDKWTGYVSGGAGKDFYSWEVGTSYVIDKHWELNVNYRDIKAKSLSVPGLIVESSHGNAIIGASGFTADMEFKGPGFGVTYKF